MSGTDRPSGKAVFALRYGNVPCGARTFIESWVHADAEDLREGETMGQIEGLRSLSTKTNAAFGRLIEVLFESDLLTKEEVEWIAGARLR